MAVWGYYNNYLGYYNCDLVLLEQLFGAILIVIGAIIMASWGYSTSTWSCYNIRWGSYNYIEDLRKSFEGSSKDVWNTLNKRRLKGL